VNFVIYRWGGVFALIGLLAQEDPRQTETKQEHRQDTKKEVLQACNGWHSLLAQTTV